MVTSLALRSLIHLYIINLSSRERMLVILLLGQSVSFSGVLSAMSLLMGLDVQTRMGVVSE